MQTGTAADIIVPGLFVALNLVLVAFGIASKNRMKRQERAERATDAKT